MNRAKEVYKKQKNRIWIVFGMLAVSLIVLPCLLLGEGSYVQVHDQMDGEILNYIYRAKYLFCGNSITEFMNGMPKASMIPPAPLGVLFFKILPPFAAYLFMQWVGLLTGFLGMRGLCKEMGAREEVASVIAILFAWIPFYPSYGITAWGQPLLLWCYLRLLRGEKKWRPLLGMIFYASFSSLTLFGYVWIGVGFLAICYWLIRKERRNAVKTALAVGALFFVYLLTNLELVTSLLGEGFTTHRQEMVLRPAENSGSQFMEFLLRGGPYHPVYSAAILIFTVVLLLYLKVACDLEKERLFSVIAKLLIAIGVCIVLATLWNCGVIVSIRRSIGGIVTYFQADRISWVLPMLWMLLLACECEMVCTLTASKDRAAVLAFLCAGVVIVDGALIFRDSTFNKNIRLLLFPNYKQITWESIYMEKVFDRIDEVIGEDKTKVSVASLGIYPSVALYNGYICADGYSNNYDVEYKHEFRKIIAEELEKNEEVKSYFDDWGNRLYLVSAEYGFDSMIAKGRIEAFHDLAYDRNALRDLNIGYIFAAAPINNAEELGLTPVRATPFSDETAYYEIWIYKCQ